MQTKDLQNWIYFYSSELISINLKIASYLPYLHLRPWPSEVLFTLGELYPRQTGQPREDCLGEDLGEGQV